MTGSQRAAKRLAESLMAHPPIPVGTDSRQVVRARFRSRAKTLRHEAWIKNQFIGKHAMRDRKRARAEAEKAS